MHILLQGLLVAIIVVSAGVCPPVAVVQEQGDDGLQPMGEGVPSAGSPTCTIAWQPLGLLPTAKPPLREV
jgi:hypothetical protein